VDVKLRKLQREWIAGSDLESAQKYITELERSLGLSPLEHPVEPAPLQKFIADPGWTCRYSSVKCDWIYTIDKKTYRSGEVIKLLAEHLRKALGEENIEKALKHPKDCSASTGICGQMTFGRGKLDNNGYWEIPCEECAENYEANQKEFWEEYDAMEWVKHPDKELRDRAD